MIRNLEPKSLWNHFADLNAVPRPSKKEEKVIQFMLDFGKKLGLVTKKDAIGNVIIYKPATAGMENRKKVILQSHLDMVHQKNEGTNFDFATQGIEMLIKEDWVCANGTTLGADNGLGVAAIMAVLSSDEISHPDIEAMFTIDEETGMTGAMELDASNFSGEILLNLDTEDDDELSIGCAGGIDTNTLIEFSESSANQDCTFFDVSVKGLQGGHSGMDIHKGFGNANKLMNRILLHLDSVTEIALSSIDGGSLRNAIPRESSAVFAVEKEKKDAMKKAFDVIKKQIFDEYQSIEKELEIELIPTENTAKVVSEEGKKSIFNSISAVHNGVFRWSPDIADLVETSSSLARVILKNGVFTTQSLQRSSIESGKKEVANAVKSVFEMIGAKVEQGGDYPGWRPNAQSEILELMAKMYREKFNEEPQVKACHAGLECGILSEKLPQVDMISFGPNIRGAHSPDEKVQISSVQKFWNYLLDVLEQIPKK